MNTSNITRSFPRTWTDFLNRSATTTAVETSILLLIGLMAIGGNLLVVISIYRNPNLRTITNYFVLSLSLADMVYSAILLPITINWSVKSRFVFEQTTLCDFQGISLNALVFVSIMNMVFMAVNRFVKVCGNQKFQNLQTKNVNLFIIAAIWISSFIFVFIYSKVGNFTDITFKPSQIRCGFVYKKLHDTTSKVLGNTVLIVSLTAPFTALTFCYYKVFKRIREHKRQTFPQELRNIPNRQGQDSLRFPAGSSLPVPQNPPRDPCVFSRTRSLGTNVQEIKITWTVFAVLLGYCVSWIPVLIVLSVSSLQGENNIPRPAQMIVTYMGSSSCVINPIIYGVMNPSFRREYKKIFCRT